MSRDPVSGVAKSVCHRDRRPLSTGNSVASAERTSAARHRGNLRLLSAFICVNRVSRDPVFSGSFEVRAGFGIGGIYTDFIAGLNSKRPASMEFKEPFQTVKVPPTFWDFVRNYELHGINPGLTMGTKQHICLYSSNIAH